MIVTTNILLLFSSFNYQENSIQTFSGGRSIPKFPRERMMPSASRRISSKWVNPFKKCNIKNQHYITTSREGILNTFKRMKRHLTSTFSILANIWVWLRSPSLERNSRACITWMTNIIGYKEEKDHGSMVFLSVE